MLCPRVCVFQFLCHISSKLLIVCMILFFIIHERRKQTYFTVFFFSLFSILVLFIFFSSIHPNSSVTSQLNNRIEMKRNETNQKKNVPLKLTVCEETYSPKSFRYHPGLWSGKKWSCCKTVNRTAFGCQAATLWTETNNNPSPSKLSFEFLFFLNSIRYFLCCCCLVLIV